MTARVRAEITLTRFGAALAFATGVFACTYPTTEVAVTVDTDVPPERALVIHASATRSPDAGTPGTWDRTWTRGEDGGISLPASFGVVPAGATGSITLEIAAEVGDAGRFHPAAVIHRTARFSFVSRQTTALRVFLPLRCADHATGCTSVPDAQCTIAKQCEDHALTCGDRGECVSVDVAPVPPDASVAMVDPDRAYLLRTVAMYPGPGDVANMRALESWLMRPIDRFTDFTGANAWSDIESPQYLLTSWAGTRYAATLGVSLLPADGTSTLARGAAGAYDNHFALLAQALVANGFGSAIIGLGPDTNAEWEPGYAGSDANSYVAYFRRVVTVMRAVPGAAGLRFMWTAIARHTAFDTMTAYPGDDVVDYLGVSFADDTSDATIYPIPAGADAATRRARWDSAWNDLTTGPQGLNTWAAMARAHNRPLAIARWSLLSTSTGGGGGDNPTFVDHVAAWVIANHVAFQSYYDYDAGQTANLRGGQFPTAAERYRTLFGAM